MRRVTLVIAASILLSATALARSDLLSDYNIDIEEDFNIIRVLYSRGPCYIFSPGARAVPIETGHVIEKGDIVATGPIASVTLDFQSNAVAVLAPNTKLLIRGHTRHGIRWVTLIEGKIFIRTKPHFQDRAPGLLINIRDFPEGLMGKNYTLIFEKKRQHLEIHEGKVNQYNLAQIEKLALVKERREFEDDHLDPDILLGRRRHEVRITTPDLEDLDFSREELNQIPIEIERINLREYEFRFRNINHSKNEFINSDESSSSFSEGAGSNITYNGSLFFNWATGILSNFFKVRAWAEYGNGRNIYRPLSDIFEFNSEGRSPLEVSEIYFKRSWRDVGIILGRKAIHRQREYLDEPGPLDSTSYLWWGSQIPYTILNTITPMESYDPTDIRPLGNFIVGMWFNPYDKFKASINLFPFFIPHKSNRKFYFANSSPQRFRLDYPEGQSSSFTIHGQVEYLGYLDTVMVGMTYGPALNPSYFLDLSKTDSGGIIEETPIGVYSNVIKGMASYAQHRGNTHWTYEGLYHFSHDNTQDDFAKGLISFRYEKLKDPAFLHGFIFELNYMLELTTQKKSGTKNSFLRTDSSSVGRDRELFDGSFRERRYRNNLTGALFLRLSPSWQLGYQGNIDFKTPYSHSIFSISARHKKTLLVNLTYESLSNRLTNTG